MGSCISKCKLRPPKRKSKAEDDHHQDCVRVEDKLVVISHDEHPPPMKIPKIPLEVVQPSIISPAPSSSFSISTNAKRRMATTTSSSFSSSSSSSLSSVKGGHSFSSELLRSCTKDNPGLIGLSHMMNQPNIPEKPSNTIHKTHRHNLGYHPSPLHASSMQLKPKQPLQESPAIITATPKKRARASSPTLMRQKSFRKEHNRTHTTSNRAHSSPSPSKRFNPKAIPMHDNPSRRHIVSKPTMGVVKHPLKKETFQAPGTSPNRDIIFRGNLGVPLMRTDMVQQKVITKVGEDRVGECRKEMDSVMEDSIDNPHIALDCFIFL